MFNFFGRKINKAPQSRPQEPEFLNEYMVDIGRSTVYEIARNEKEAKQNVVRRLHDGTEFYDSRKLKSSKKLDEARVHPNGDIRVYLYRENVRRNPNYR